MAGERYTSDTTDFRSQLGKLFAANPDALHLAPQSEFSAGAIIKQARELGYEGADLRGNSVVGNDCPGSGGRRSDGHEGHHG